MKQLRQHDINQIDPMEPCSLCRSPGSRSKQGPKLTLLQRVSPRPSLTPCWYSLNDQTVDAVLDQSRQAQCGQFGRFRIGRERPVL
jgi:hypothetical protein